MMKKEQFYLLMSVLIVIAKMVIRKEDSAGYLEAELQVLNVRMLRLCGYKVDA